MTLEYIGDILISKQEMDISGLVCIYSSDTYKHRYYLNTVMEQ